jgi:hypothetical protein
MYVLVFHNLQFFDQWCCKAFAKANFIMTWLCSQAQELWFAVLEAQIETGTPYILFKDACNSKSNQKNLGTIKCSNCKNSFFPHYDNLATSFSRSFLPFSEHIHTTSWPKFSFVQPLLPFKPTPRATYL